MIVSQVSPLQVKTLEPNAQAADATNVAKASASGSAYTPVVGEKVLCDFVSGRLYLCFRVG
jgi:hypothetical protein